jgi:hypothetical protein
LNGSLQNQSQFGNIPLKDVDHFSDRAEPFNLLLFLEDVEIDFCRSDVGRSQPVPDFCGNLLNILSRHITDFP